MACYFPLISTNNPPLVVNVLEKKLIRIPLPSLLYTDSIVSGKYVGMLSAGRLNVFALSSKAVVLDVPTHVKGSDVAGMWGDDKVIVLQNYGLVLAYEILGRPQVVARLSSESEAEITRIRGHNGNVVIDGEKPFFIRSGEQKIHRVKTNETIIGIGHNWYATGSTSRVVVHTPNGCVETSFVGDFNILPTWVDYHDGCMIGIFSPLLLGVSKKAVIVWNKTRIIGLAIEMESPQVVVGEGRFYAMSPSVLLEWDACGLVNITSLPSFKKNTRTTSFYQCVHEMLTGKEIHPRLLSAPSATLLTLSKSPSVKDWLSITREVKNIEMYVDGHKITP